jgi:hypothetical protein
VLVGLGGLRLARLELKTRSDGELPGMVPTHLMKRRMT